MNKDPGLIKKQTCSGFRFGFPLNTAIGRSLPVPERGVSRLISEGVVLMKRTEKVDEVQSWRALVIVRMINGNQNHAVTTSGANKIFGGVGERIAKNKQTLEIPSE